MLTSMFRSATIRLTGWYLLILMTLSIIFSLTIYQITSSEVQTRLERFQSNLQVSDDFTPPPMMGASALRASQVNEAKANISIELIYVNLFVLVAGGFGSYFLARRSLLPIERAHEVQSRFTSDASHELRTPLAVMKTELEVALRDKNASTDSLKEILASNLEEVDKLSKLSEMLLNLSRFDHAKLKLEPVNLTKVVRIIVDDFNKLSNDRISIDSQKHLIVHGNEMALSELVKVLVDNALLYSPKDSPVTVTLSKQDYTAKFEVTNTGAGINEEKLPFIFDRFYRADSSRTNGNRKGYGLGLALAKSVVELHNGELIASSTPDIETTFTFLLPLNSDIQAKTKN